MNEPAGAIHNAGQDPRVAGINQKWSGSISRQVITMHHGSYHYLRLPDEPPRSDNFVESHRSFHAIITKAPNSLTTPV